MSRRSRDGAKEPRNLTLEDVKGSIRKPVSYWAIDESGNPSRREAEAGRAFTLSAVTELSPIDYDRLLEGIPLHNGEVHFNKLRNKCPDICIRLMSRLGEENILILSKTVTKNRKAVKRFKGVPIDETYLFALLNEVLQAICVADSSDTVIVTYDRNSGFREDMCYILWNDRCILVMGDSDAYRLLQTADLCASAVGRAVLPEGFREDVYLDKIRRKAIELEHEPLKGKKGEGANPDTHPGSCAPSESTRKSEYIKSSPKGKKSGRLADRTQRPALTFASHDARSGHKKHRLRSIFNRFSRKGGRK